MIEVDEDGEHADIVICMRLTSPLAMPDNQIGICAECGEAIQHRPHVPKLPRKVCAECVMSLAAATKSELHTIITPETVAELKAYFRKKRAN